MFPERSAVIHRWPPQSPISLMSAPRSTPGLSDADALLAPTGSLRRALRQSGCTAPLISVTVMSTWAPGRTLGCSATNLRSTTTVAHSILSWPAEARQACRRAIGAVAVRSVAVDDEERVGRVHGQIPLVDLSVRQIDGAGHVSRLERLWRTHVQQDEVLRVAAE